MTYADGAGLDTRILVTGWTIQSASEVDNADVVLDDAVIPIFSAFAAGTTLLGGLFLLRAKLLPPTLIDNGG